jgi:hypothetical protein
MNRIIAAARLSQDEAQNDIAAAIADRAVKVRCKLKEHATKFKHSSDVLDGAQFEIPPDLKAKHLDWEESRPPAPWLVRRGTFDLPGFWTLDWIELFKTDVTNVLCPAGQASVEERPSETRLTSRERPALESNPTGPAPGASGAPSPGPAAARRRGAHPRKFEQTKAAMRGEIEQGRRTVAELSNMLEKNLAETYGVSRDTARKARRAVLSEFGEN